MTLHDVGKVFERVKREKARFRRGDVTAKRGRLSEFAAPSHQNKLGARVRLMREGIGRFKRWERLERLRYCFRLLERLGHLLGLGH